MKNINYNLNIPNSNTTRYVANYVSNHQALNQLSTPDQLNISRENQSRINQNLNNSSSRLMTYNNQGIVDTHSNPIAEEVARRQKLMPP